MAGEQKQKDKRFYFVSPSVKDGDIDAYPGSRVFSQSSWEWLLERYLRRRIVLGALGVDRPSDYLSGRAGVYRLGRLLSEGTVDAREPPRPDLETTPLPAGSSVPDDSNNSNNSSNDEDDRPVFVSEETDFNALSLARLVPELALAPPSGGWAVPGDPSDCVVADLPVDSTADETASWSASQRFQSSYGTVPDPEDPNKDKVTVDTRTLNAKWEVKDSIAPGKPLDVTRLPLFKMLGDFRLDDEPVRKDVPVWDADRGEFRDRGVWVHPSPVVVTFDDDPDTGEIRTVVPDDDHPQRAVRALVFQGGLSSVTAETAFPVCAKRPDGALDDFSDKEELSESENNAPGGGDGPSGGGEQDDDDPSWRFKKDLAPPAGSTAQGAVSLAWPRPLYARPGKAALADVVGVCEGVPEPKRGGVGVLPPPVEDEAGDEGESGSGAGEEEDETPTVLLDMLPSPDWDGRPTWWAAHGFPHVDPAPVSREESDQVKGLLVSQPAVPPFVRGGLTRFPSGGGESRADAAKRLRTGGLHWLSPVVPACGPAEISRHLDALETTVTPVDTVFAFVRCSTVTSSETRSSGGALRARRVTEETSGTFAGTIAQLLALASRPCEQSATGKDKVTSNYSGVETSSTSTYTFAGSVSCNAVATGLCPVKRNAVQGKAKLKRDVTTLRTTNNGSSTTVTPDPTVEPGDPLLTRPPDDDDKVVSPDVARWVESAGLYLFADVVSVEDGGGTSSESLSRTVTSSTVISNGQETSSTRVTEETSELQTEAVRHATRRVVVAKVGDLDPETGGVSAEVDLVGLMRRLDPYPDVPCDLVSRLVEGDDAMLQYDYYGADYETTHTTTFTSSEGGTSSNDVFESSLTFEKPLVADVPDVRKMRLYLVVRWKFDTGSPPEPPGTDAARLVQDFVKARDAVRAAKASLTAARGAAAVYGGHGYSAALDRLEARMGPSPGDDALAALADARSAVRDLDNAVRDLDNAVKRAATPEARADDALAAARALLTRKTADGAADGAEVFKLAADSLDVKALEGAYDAADGAVRAVRALVG